MTLGANGVLNKLFIAFLFSDHDVGVQFLKDVGMIPSSIACCNFGSQLSWYLDSVVKVICRWRCLKAIFASACRASTSITYGTRFQQSNLKFMEVVLLTYNIVHRVSAPTIQQEHQFGSATITDCAKLCRLVMLDYVLTSSQ